MTTQNIEIQKGNWQDVITLGSLTLEQDKTYTIGIRGSKYGEVYIGDDTPENTAKGHLVFEETNFNFIYTGEKIWCKLGITNSQTATIVIS